METMRKLMKTAAIAALCVTFLGAGAGAGVQVGFSPPPGWTRTSFPGTIGAWVGPGAPVFRQNVNLVAEPYQGSVERLAGAALKQLHRVFPDLTLGVSQAASVCGDHPAHYFAYITSMGGRRVLIEQMLTVWGKYGFTATYTRAASQPSIAAARISLTTICGVVATKPAASASASPKPAASPTPTPGPATNNAPGGSFASPVPLTSAAPTVTPRSGY